ncbi:MAG TPA: class I SAM-dependent methyltransferase [Pyrinomonadaceae bacterium]|nr:class I SAM-dependent methyltransferase [Pyrinomonadaceae bacterium]
MKNVLKSAVRKSFNVVGLEVHRRNDHKSVQLIEGNLVVPNLWVMPSYCDLIAARIDTTNSQVVLLGDREQIDFLIPGIERRGLQASGIVWNWDQDFDSLPPDATIVLCKLPLTENQWRTVRALKSRHGSKVVGIQELALPFTNIHQAQASLTYSVENFDELTNYYLGKDDFGGFFQELNSACPLAGKRVIEFGPMEGAQTATLVNLGAASVTCIEARAESFIKTMIAHYCFNWQNVEVIMDDFHNADVRKYGKFDLAFAHGVYYHSIAPFFFFENLMSLSDNIFIGGYCIGPDYAGADLETLEYEGRKFPAKRLAIGNSFNNAVNEYAYHLRNVDLIDFFRDRNYHVNLMMDEAIDDPWGEMYIRFLATKKS